jgi:hypothetical protein
VTTVAFAPDGRILLTRGSDGAVLVGDAKALPKAKLSAWLRGRKSRFR